MTHKTPWEITFCPGPCLGTALPYVDPTATWCIQTKLFKNCNNRKYLNTLSYFASEIKM